MQCTGHAAPIHTIKDMPEPPVFIHADLSLPTGYKYGLGHEKGGLHARSQLEQTG
jgi:hypothetical protein